MFKYLQNYAAIHEHSFAIDVLTAVLVGLSAGIAPATESSQQRYLIHDRDTKFTAQFDRILRDAGVKAIYRPRVRISTHMPILHASELI